MNNQQDKAWFASWFDSPWYPILYQNRDDREAFTFLDRLLEKLNAPDGSSMLDLACGRGRHARRLAQGPYQVTGLDLSEKSIAFAKQFESDNLRFERHDMRQVYRSDYFDYIFNFFTSFGYFDHDEDHLLAFEAVYAGLREGGSFVIDFMNSAQVIANLQENDVVKRDQIEFRIHKHYDGKHIIKSIEFEADEKLYRFEEKVRAFKKEALQRGLEKVGFDIKACWGDYHLADFDEQHSERVILLAQKSG
jgi:SAM-dependent methyltransferase